MTTVKVKLELAENVKQFNNLVSQYPGDVDLRSGRYVVDAKSILGILSLDLSAPVIMEIHGEHPEELIERIGDYLET